MTDRHVHCSAGLLVLAGLLAGLASVAPAIDTPDYFTTAPAAIQQIKLAAFAQLIMALTYLGFAALLYPRLRPHGPELAVAFLGGRCIAVALSIISTVTLLMLLELTRQNLALPASDLPLLSSLGGMLKTSRDHLNHVFMIVLFGSANAAFYLLALRAQILPRGLALWGLTGIMLAVLASSLFFFGAFNVISAPYLLLNLPAVTSEFLLGGWLLFRGARHRIATPG